MYTARAPATSAPRRSPTRSRTPGGPRPARASAPSAVTVIGRPGTPSTPQATADNATATVTWQLPPANGAPLTAVELQPEGLAPITLGVTSSHTLTGLVNGRPYRFQVRAQNEAGWGEWSAFVGSRHARHDPGPGADPERRVRRRPAHGQLAGTAQRGLGADRLRDRDRWWTQLRHLPRHGDHLRVGRAHQRHQLPVPHRGR